MTKLNCKLSREMVKARAKARPIILTLSPGTDSRDDLLGMRLKGTRTTYIGRVLDLYRMLALWHANKIMAAKRQARRNGVPWRVARVNFQRQNSL
jgi:hypothetical protein